MPGTVGAVPVSGSDGSSGKRLLRFHLAVPALLSDLENQFRQLLFLVPVGFLKREFPALILPKNFGISLAQTGLELAKHWPILAKNRQASANIG